ncbi:type IV secretory system conjugative DNA transfer family protein [Mycobacteroides abscessus]|uniref:type IV secretory system conjugative DNA transfer family protein n=1 Tax=Mycobacteroides abscessus TaxID=36809 RepID=UPI002350DD94|nr:type IV secretory system conjugative DNA transfer family protein [Mycobacteroides abscessus]
MPTASKTPASPPPPPKPFDRRAKGRYFALGGGGILLFAVGRLGHPEVLEWPSLLWLPGIAMFAFGGAAWLRPGPAPAALTPVPSPAPMAAPAPAPIVTVEPNPAPTPSAGVPFQSQIQRIYNLFQSGKPGVEVIHDSVEVNAKGQLTKYRLRVTPQGYLAKGRNCTMVIDTLSKGTHGNFDFKPNEAEDYIDATERIPFPPIIPPPPLPFPIAQTPADAVKLYKKFKFAIGVDQFGKRLEFSPIQYHHLLIIGGSGSGKSVFIRGLIELYRAAGFAVFLCDGKGTDYTTHNDVVTAVSSDIPEHVRMMHALVEELQRRRKKGRERKLAGDPNAMDFEPWVMVFDEFSDARDSILADYDSNGSDKIFIKDLKSLLKLAREFRIHLILSSQDAYASSFPRSLVGNLGLIISLGKPEKMTLDNAFPKSLQSRARQIGQSISKEMRGRGIVADPEAGTVIEFQSYYSYYPGAIIEDQLPEIQAAWTQYRDNVSNRIPRLYSRQWFKVESAEDLDQPISELNKIPMVNLDLPSGEPNPDVVQYDKQHPAYNGNNIGDAGGEGLLPLRVDP